MHVVRKETFHI